MVIVIVAIRQEILTYARTAALAHRLNRSRHHSQILDTRQQLSVRERVSKFNFSKSCLHSDENMENDESSFTSNCSQLTQLPYVDLSPNVDSSSYRCWPYQLKFHQLRHPHEASRSLCATVESPARKFKNRHEHSKF